jgi:hypothetical protein
MKAWETELIGTVSIVFADNRSKAKYRTFFCAWDAGYRPKIGVDRITVRRRKDLDGSAMISGGTIKPGVCYSEYILLKGSK